jgi:murein DD-endopeptidase MepM/ murein hydrolase activator NlpD
VAALGSLVYVLVRTPKKLASVPHVNETWRPEAVAPVGPPPRTVPSRRRLHPGMRVALFVLICGLLAGIPFALNAYAAVPVVPPVEVPTEELEPLPPSYEQAGLSEEAPIDTTEIVRDATSFRSSDRELRLAERRATARAYVLPVDASLVTPEALVAKHHDYPAADLGLPKGSDVHAAHAGTVRTVTKRGRCGRGVVVSGADGFNYIYCHGSEVLVDVGDEVKAGALIMFSGNTGHSTGPHLHFGIETSDGTRVCPQDLLLAWYEGAETSPDEARTKGCFYASEKIKGKKHEGHRDRDGSREDAPRSDDRRDGGGDGGGTRPTPRPRPTPTPDPSPSPEPEPEPSPAETADASGDGTG